MIKTGFESFSQKRISGFLWGYWTLFLGVYIYAIWQAVLWEYNPFIFLIIGFFPYPFSKVYKLFRRPLKDFDTNIKELDPDLFGKIERDLSLKHNFKNKDWRPGVKKSMLAYTILTQKEKSTDPRINTFIKNLYLLDSSSAYSLFIWFFTFFIFLAIGFFNSL